jgi:molybdopterin-binding protein
VLLAKKSWVNTAFSMELLFNNENAKAIRQDRLVRPVSTELLMNTIGREEVNLLKLSARNVLKGKVKSIQHGAVNSEVIVQIPGGIEIVSIITKTAAQNLQLKEGKEVYAIVKATNVILGTD